MCGPDRLDEWQYPKAGKVKLTGKPVSAVKVKLKEYSKPGSYVPGRERVSQPYPPLIQKKQS